MLVIDTERNYAADSAYDFFPPCGNRVLVAVAISMRRMPIMTLAVILTAGIRSKIDFQFIWYFVIALQECVRR